MLNDKLVLSSSLICHVPFSRRGPLDPAEYTMHPWAGHYMSVPQAPQGYHKAPSYPHPNLQSPPSFSNYPPSQPYSRPGDPRGVDSSFYPHPR